MLFVSNGCCRPPEDPEKIQGRSREDQEKINRSSRDDLKQIQRRSREDPEKIKRISREYQENIQGRSREYQGKIKGRSREYQGNIQGRSREDQGNIQRISRELSTNQPKSLASPRTCKHYCLYTNLKSPSSMFFGRVFECPKSNETNFNLRNNLRFGLLFFSWSAFILIMTRHVYRDVVYSHLSFYVVLLVY